MGVLKLVNKAVGSSKEVVEQNKEKLVLRRVWVTSMTLLSLAQDTFLA